MKKELAIGGGLTEMAHKAMAYADVPKFMQVLRAQETLAAQAFQFLILTAARLSEVTGASWSEIDLAATVWTIPASRTKAGKEHRVPLSLIAVAILNQAAEFRIGDLPVRSSGETARADVGMGRFNFTRPSIQTLDFL